jgi:hypothetical protein
VTTPEGSGAATGDDGAAVGEGAAVGDNCRGLRVATGGGAA